MYVALQEVTWHGMVYAEHAEMAAVSIGTSHIRAKQHCKYIT